MRAGGGKQKGASFEREVCVALSEWLSGGLQQDIFWRSAMSGGRATVAYKKGVSLGAQAGDISCIKSIGMHFISQFAPECKFYADLDYKGLLTGKGKLLAFWAEINQQASRYGKLPFLIARQNRMPTFVCLNRAGMTKLGLHTARCVLISPPHDLYLIEAGKFFKKCKPYVAGNWRSPSNRPRKRLIQV